MTRADATSQPQRRPYSADDRRLLPRRRTAIGVPPDAHPRMLILAKGLRYRGTDTTIEVAYGSWHWTTRVLLLVAVVSAFVGIAAGFAVRVLAG